MNKPVTYHAAGGVVMRENGAQILVLTRAGRNDVRLPKGHIEPGETVEQAAIREVQEETGYADVAIVADLGSLTHTFYDFLKDREVTRTESYFLMHLTSERDYKGLRLDHENFVRRWVRRDEAERLLTYDSEREFIRRARRALSTRTASTT
jgi:8-oxo-dGTP pyrophosphatase MutT (NUDIX family)